MELVDVLDSDSSGATRAGSNPVSCTKIDILILILSIYIRDMGTAPEMVLF